MKFFPGGLGTRGQEQVRGAPEGVRGPSGHGEMG